jgi:hypothetical protein
MSVANAIRTERPQLLLAVLAFTDEEPKPASIIQENLKANEVSRSSWNASLPVPIVKEREANRRH